MDGIELLVARALSGATDFGGAPSRPRAAAASSRTLGLSSPKAWVRAGIAAWAAIYAPQKVLVGGGIAALGEVYLAAVCEGLCAVGQPHLTSGIRVEPAMLGADAGVIGAAAIGGLGLEA